MKLNEDFNPASRWLIGYRLFGEHHQETIWVDMFTDTVKELYRRYPDSLMDLAKKNIWVHSTDYDEPKKYEKIADGCYLWKNSSNRNKLTGLRYLFEELDLALGELVILIEPRNAMKEEESLTQED